MEITPTTLILVGVVCVVLGFLASVLLNILADEGEAPDEGTDAAPPGGRKGRYTPVFRIWREKGAGTLVVEMDGKSMIAPDPLNAVQRERLERTAGELRTWLGMGLPDTQASQQEEGLAVQEPAAQPSEIDLRRTLINEPINPPAPIAPAQQAANPPVRPPVRVQVSTAGQSTAQKGKRFQAADVAAVAAGAGAAPATTKAAPAAKSIVLQIEDILQDMIAGSELAQRGVHLLEDPIQGVIVQIGLEQYVGIDSVPDPHIKGIIQSAVKEWESSQ